MKDVVVVETLMRPEIRCLNAKAGYRDRHGGNNPFSMLSSNMSRMDAGSQECSRRADRQERDIPKTSKPGLFKVSSKAVKGASGKSGNRSGQKSEAQQQPGYSVSGMDCRQEVDRKK